MSVFLFPAHSRPGPARARRCSRGRRDRPRSCPRGAPPTRRSPTTAPRACARRSSGRVPHLPMRRRCGGHRWRNIARAGLGWRRRSRETAGARCAPPMKPAASRRGRVRARCQKIAAASLGLLLEILGAFGLLHALRRRLIREQARFVPERCRGARPAKLSERLRASTPRSFSSTAPRRCSLADGLCRVALPVGAGATLAPWAWPHRAVSGAGATLGSWRCGRSALGLVGVGFGLARARCGVGRGIGRGGESLPASPARAASSGRCRRRWPPRSLRAASGTPARRGAQADRASHQLPAWRQRESRRRAPRAAARGWPRARLASSSGSIFAHDVLIARLFTHRSIAPSVFTRRAGRTNRFAICLLRNATGS